LHQFLLRLESCLSFLLQVGCHEGRPSYKGRLALLRGAGGVTSQWLASLLPRHIYFHGPWALMGALSMLLLHGNVVPGSPTTTILKHSIRLSAHHLAPPR
jgi:hypothetical protein